MLESRELKSSYAVNPNNGFRYYRQEYGGQDIDVGPRDLAWLSFDTTLSTRRLFTKKTCEVGSAAHTNKRFRDLQTELSPFQRLQSLSLFELEVANAQNYGVHPDQTIENVVDLIPDIHQVNYYIPDGEDLTIFFTKLERHNSNTKYLLIAACKASRNEVVIGELARHGYFFFRSLQEAEEETIVIEPPVIAEEEDEGVVEQVGISPNRLIIKRNDISFFPTVDTELKRIA